jgi:hypothetical protein
MPCEEDGTIHVCHQAERITALEGDYRQTRLDVDQQRRDLEKQNELIQTRHNDSMSLFQELLAEVKGLRGDVTGSVRQMGEYLGMGKLIQVGIRALGITAGIAAPILLGFGRYKGWW